jgi:hemerythrin-like domain-containing protein
MGKYVERGRRPPHAIMDGDPDAVAFIKEEHQMFRALFDRAEEENPGPALMSLAGEICLRLAVHMNVEETVLYPALRATVGADKINEGIVEHGVAKTLIGEILQMTGGEKLYRSKVHVLGEEVMHHVDEEDQGLLSDARTAWEEGKLDLHPVWLEMLERRLALFDSVAAARAKGEAAVIPSGDLMEDVPAPAPPQRS